MLCWLDNSPGDALHGRGEGSSSAGLSPETDWAMEGVGFLVCMLRWLGFGCGLESVLCCRGMVQTKQFPLPGGGGKGGLSTKTGWVQSKVQLP